MQGFWGQKMRLDIYLGEQLRTLFLAELVDVRVRNPAELRNARLTAHAAGYSLGNGVFDDEPVRGRRGAHGDEENHLEAGLQASLEVGALVMAIVLSPSAPAE